MTHRDWIVLATAAVLHLLLLCAPILLLGDIGRIGGDPGLVIFFFLAGSWCLFESIVAPNRASPRMPANGPRWLAPAIGLALLATFWVTVVDTVFRVPNWPGAVAGAVLMVAGIALRCFSIRSLGRYFLDEVSLLPGQPLVTEGLYGWLRHPSEAGTMCLAFGGAVLLGSPAGMSVCIAILLPCVVWRTRLEDRMLRRHYSTEFARYAREVPAFLPRISHGVFRHRHMKSTSETGYTARHC